jgi:ribonuclease T1
MISGHQDGTEFQNREGKLPAQGPGYYSEWTVDTPSSATRGARRIVAGQNGDQYDTPDHYTTGIPLPKY